MNARYAVADARYDKRAHWPYDRVDEGLTKTAGQCPERWEDLVEAESERQLADPPATWQEHWFDHRQLLRLYHSDEHCAIYVDPDVRWAEVRWLPRFINVTWQYSKATYGDAFGFDPRIYSIHHAGRHGGGHAGYYVSPVHDYHNVSDCGLDTWREGNALARELPAHEIGHSVESANNGVHGSPAYEIWGDSKWAEFYIYDLYTALGMDREAKGVYRRFTGNTDDFPRRGTRWFRDWFYPLWRDCGRAEVMNRFFRELARHFPRDSGGTYTRRMNWGEYVHFTSGAAAADMSGQAARAFGWPREWACNSSTPASSSPAYLLGELHGEGQTILLTTHYMEEADRLCERVAIMDHGRILALDTPAALKQSIGADTIVTVRTTGDISKLAELLAGDVAGVTRTRVADDRLELHMQGGDRLVPRIVLSAERGGFELIDVSIAEPSLETVFISLTGKELRD